MPLTVDQCIPDHNPHPAVICLPSLLSLPHSPCLDLPQVSLENANRLLDLVAAGSEPSYDAIRDRLAKHYLDAGLRDVANFLSTTI